MKKLILSIALVGVAVMVSCSSEKKAEDKGADLKAKIENCTNPDSLKIYVQEAKDYADKLVKEGKTEAATIFINEVTPSVEAKDPAAALVLGGLELKAKADSTAEAAKEAAKNLADSTSKTIGEKVDDVNKAVSDKASDIKDKASDVINNAKDKTVDAAKSGAEKVKDLVGK